MIFEKKFEHKINFIINWLNDFRKINISSRHYFQNHNDKNLQTPQVHHPHNNFKHPTNIFLTYPNLLNIYSITSTVKCQTSDTRFVGHRKKINIECKNIWLMTIFMKFNAFFVHNQLTSVFNFSLWKYLQYNFFSSTCIHPSISIQKSILHNDKSQYYANKS